MTVLTGAEKLGHRITWWVDAEETSCDPTAVVWIGTSEIEKVVDSGEIIGARSR